MIKLDDISKKYGNKDLFLHFSMEFAENGISCIVGASGVGKTTILNMLAGLVKPDSGRVCAVSESGEKLKGSYVFQEPRLFPWYNVHDNLDFILKNVRDDGNRRFYSKEERSAMIESQLRLVGLEDYEFSRLTELSGGMVQRVALCRAFLYPADIIYLDEPFKEQDSKRKKELYDMFLREYQNDKKRRTVIFVTHDISEAITLADDIFVLSGRPAEVTGSFARSGFDDDTWRKIRELI